MIALE